MVLLIAQTIKFQTVDIFCRLISEINNTKSPKQQNKNDKKKRTGPVNHHKATAYPDGFEKNLVFRRDGRDLNVEGKN